MGGADPGPLASLHFRGQWRRYQRLALEAFEEDRSHGRLHTHVVAPPGSGKTLLGVEMVRRIGRRAVVLAPNTAIQTVWLRTVARFCPPEAGSAAVAGPTPEAPVACLTYQSLCRLDDPGSALEELAETRWVIERARATGSTPDEVRAEAAAWSGAAATRRRSELARVRTALKREIAKGGHDLDLTELLAPTALERLHVLRERGVGTLVLDECHHLASLWGYVVRAAVGELGDLHLIGLTATPPEELTSDEAELYAELLGPVDFTVPTPAVVKDGYLAPYQELAWLTEPLDSEVRWLREHDRRFDELVAQLHDEEAEDGLGFPAWVITRMRHRERESGGEVGWERFQKRRPALARAGIRFLASGGLPLPEGAPRGEGYRQPPDLEGWAGAARGLRAALSADQLLGAGGAPLRRGWGSAARPGLPAHPPGHQTGRVGRGSPPDRIRRQADRARGGPRMRVRRARREPACADPDRRRGGHRAPGRRAPRCARPRRGDGAPGRPGAGA